MMEVLGNDIELGGNYSQESERQNQYDRKLRPRIHLYVPYEEDRQYTKDPIGDGRNGTVCVGDTGYDISS